MKSIYNNYDNKEIINRIDLLDNDSSPIWGKTSLDDFYRQSLLELDIAYGKKDVKINQLKKTFSRILKNHFIKCLIYNDCQDFYSRKSKKETSEKELKKELIQKINRLGNQGKHAVMSLHHPFWGKMTYREWDYLVYNYLDNHLKQFGV